MKRKTNNVNKTLIAYIFISFIEVILSKTLVGMPGRDYSMQ